MSTAGLVWLLGLGLSLGGTQAVGRLLASYATVAEGDDAEGDGGPDTPRRRCDAGAAPVSP